MAEAFIEKTEYNQYLSTQDYIDQFYGDKEGISTTKILSSPILLNTSDYLFSDFTGLQYINFPNLSTISHKAFAGCINLKEANIQNVTYVDSYAFKDCLNLKILSLPSCISMKESAFEGCNSLEELYLPEFSNYVSTSYDDHHFVIKDLSNLKTLNLNKLTSGLKLINLPKLEDVSLDNLIKFHWSGYPNYRGYIENLPKLSSLTLSKLKRLDSLTFGSLPNLEMLILPECISIYNNVFYGELPSSDIIFSLPKVKYINFEGNNVFKSVILPAMVSDIDVCNNIMGITHKYLPYYIGLPNYKSMNSIFGRLQNINSSISHDLILDFNNLEYIQDGKYFRMNQYITSPEYGVILNTPILSSIPSTAFYDCNLLKEINLNNVSVLNEHTFLSCNGVYIGLSLKNAYNIKEVKACALYYTRLRGSILSLPNCEKFDFRQEQNPSLYSQIVSSYYMYGIRKIYNGMGSNDTTRINNVYLPKLSEVIIESELDSPYYSTILNCYPEQILPRDEFRLDGCKRIKFIGCSTKKFSYYSETNCSCNLLYLPECSSIEYIKGDIDTLQFMQIPVHKLYAPKLSYILDIRFLNTYDITLPWESISYISLQYWFGWVSEIDYSISFSGIISINNDCYSRKDGRVFLLSKINLPNYTGKFFLDASNTGNVAASSYLSDSIDFLFGENISNVKMTFHNMTSPNYSKDGTALNVNITALKNVINNYTLFRNSFPGLGPYGARRDKFYFPNASVISYNLSLSTLDVRSDYIGGYAKYTFEGNKYSYGNYDEYFLIWNNKCNLLSMPNVETIEVNIVSYYSISYISPYTKSFIDIRFNFSVNELYAPKLRKINYNVCDELQSVFPSWIHCGFDVYGKGASTYTSITLGISTLEDMCRLTTYEGHPSILSWYGVSMSYAKYVSMSNLKYIPPMLPIGLQLMTHTLTLQRCEYLNIENVESISDRGLQVDLLEQLDLPKLRYIGERGIYAKKLRIISVPKLEELGDYGFYSCSSLETLTLPSTCSKLGQNFCYNQGRLKVLELQYPGVVNIHSNQAWYSMTVRVPSAYLSAYKSHSIWGVQMSSYWNIVAF